MLLQFDWLETVVIFGVLLLVFGPERINEFVADVRLFLNDVGGAFRRSRK